MKYVVHINRITIINNRLWSLSIKLLIYYLFINITIICYIFDIFMYLLCHILLTFWQIDVKSVPKINRITNISNRLLSLFVKLLTDLSGNIVLICKLVDRFTYIFCHSLLNFWQIHVKSVFKINRITNENNRFFRF